MKQLHFLALIALSALFFTACDPNNPSGPIPDSFPKKHLIEEFTGQDCGYCPYGMDCIHEYIANDTNWVLVLHHAGYSQDHFTITGNTTVATALGVQGAPQIAINRAKTDYRAGKDIVFHPGYLEYTSKSQFDTETYASINIANTYNANSRELKVKISGQVTQKDIAEMTLTVLVKESGMIDYQQDYYNTFEGWQEFRHTNAVRAFLTDAKGDLVTVDKQSYRAEYTLQLDAKWVPENCIVVAFLSENFKPVIQAEQKSVVAGTKGGADIQHGGVKAVPVSDFYPEVDAENGPLYYSGKEVDTLLVSNASYQSYSQYGFNFWQISAVNTANAFKVLGTNCIRYASLYLFTETSQTAIPTGTYELNLSQTPGSAYAGFRDDEEMYIGGSTFYYTSKSYWNQGYLVPSAQWLIADGALTITDEGWELVGHARNGADIHLVGTTPIVNKGKSSAPAKAPKLHDKSAPKIEYCE